MKRAAPSLVLLLLSLAPAPFASACLAQASESMYLLGMSGYRYQIKQSDGVFATGYYTPSTAGFQPAPGFFHGSGRMFGFRFAYLRPATSRYHLRYDVELDLGLVDRKFNPYFAEATTYGIQAFAGPHFSPNKSGVSYYVLAGASYIKIPGHESWEQSGSSNIIWYGTDGQTDLWAKLLNEWNASGSATIPGYGPIQRTAFGLCLGGSGDFWKPEELNGGGMGGYLEYLPMFDGGLRNNFRLGLSITMK